MVTSLLVLLVAGPASAELEIPKLTSRVTDRAALLRPEVRSQLEGQLADYQSATGHQFAFVSIPSLEGAPIEDVSLRLAEAWKLGDERRDDGLILVVAKAERKMRIEVGYGLEGVIPDALASRIIRNQMVPAFREGDYDTGILTAFSTLMKAAEGEAVAVEPPGGKSSSKKRSLLRPLFWLMALAFLFMMNRGGGSGRRGGIRRGYYGAMGGLGMGLGGRSFGGGGFGGGGFGGGGGGFGGGGASGGW